MEQIGFVVSVENDIATVVVQRHDVCSKCGGCGVAVSGRGDNYIEAQNVVNAVVGQTVKVATDTGEVLKASFVVYIVPILALLFGIWAGQEAALALGLTISEQLFELITGVLFLLSSYFIVRSYDRRMSVERMKSSVLEIIEEPRIDGPKDEIC